MLLKSTAPPSPRLEPHAADLHDLYAHRHPRWASAACWQPVLCIAKASMTLCCWKHAAHWAGASPSFQSPAAYPPTMAALHRFDLGPSWYWPDFQPDLHALIEHLGLATLPSVTKATW